MNKQNKQAVKAILLLFLALYIGSLIGIKAQTVKQDANGNFYAIKSNLDTTKAQSTGKTFTDTKGNVYPILISKNGKLFYMKTSKAGNVYKCYLKTEA
jgi:hypothetical protein